MTDHVERIMNRAGGFTRESIPLECKAGKGCPVYNSGATDKKRFCDGEVGPCDNQRIKDYNRDCAWEELAEFENYEKPGLERPIN